MNRANRRKHGLTEQEVKEFSLHYNQIVIAEIYNNTPDDAIFSEHSPEAMAGIKNLAASLKKARKEGKIK